MRDIRDRGRDLEHVLHQVLQQKNTKNILHPPGRWPRLSPQRTASTVAHHPRRRPSPGRTRASTRLPAVVPAQALTPGSADKIHSAQIAFEILAQIGWLIIWLGWTFSQGSETKERPNHAPCCRQHFTKSLTQLGLGKFLVQFAADLQIWKYESQRSSDL